MTDWWMDESQPTGPSEFDLWHVINKYASCYRQDSFGYTRWTFYGVQTPPEAEIYRWEIGEWVYAVDMGTRTGDLFCVGRIHHIEAKSIGIHSDGVSMGSPLFEWTVATQLSHSEQEEQWSQSTFQPQPLTSPNYVSPDTRPSISTDPRASGGPRQALGRRFTELWSLM